MTRKQDFDPKSFLGGVFTSLELKRVEDHPDPGLKRVEDPDYADQFGLVFTSGNDNSVAYFAPRDQMKKLLIKFLHRLERE